MARTLKLPRADGSLQEYTPSFQTPPAAEGGPITSRRAFAAAHVVCDPLADVPPFEQARLDWDATLSYRRYLWSLGLQVAEAMDTAQRGMGLDWALSRDLIARSLAEARSVGGGIVCGAGTDHLSPGDRVSLAEVLAAYEEQVGFVEGLGGRVVLMASRALAACAAGPDDYVRVYDRILSQVRQPVILHWLGERFDPALRGYWGHVDPRRAMQTCLDVIRAHAPRVDGIKLSLLDRELEVEMRRQLPPGVHMYTGDDFNYPELILGDDQGYSDALLGVFDAIAPAAAAALHALDRGDTEAYRTILAPTVPLARHIFSPPTYYYKTGIVFLAYLNGHQRHFRMVGGLEAARSIVHLSELFILADRAGLLNPGTAVERMRRVLAMAGIEQ